MPTMTARIVHTSIERDWRDVYVFASKPENMPKWASGLAAGLTPDGDGWIAKGPLGTARVRFAPPNTSGIIDHTVTLDSGLEVFNALRVIQNGDGAEVMFTLMQLDGMTDEQFEADATHVAKDLAALKEIMES